MKTLWRDVDWSPYGGEGVNACRINVGPFAVTVSEDAERGIWYMSTSPMFILEKLGDSNVMDREYAKKKTLARLREVLQGVVDALNE